MQRKKNGPAFPSYVEFTKPSQPIICFSNFIMS